MSYKKISFLLLAAACLLTLSCDEDNLLPPANTNAYISFINASAFQGDGRAAVETNGRTDTNELRISYMAIYPEPNRYLPFTEGDCKVVFKNATRTPLVTGGITTRAGSYYSAILTDSVNTYSAAIVQDDYEAVPGKALVRVMHFSPDGGDVILYRDTTKLESFGALHFKQVTPYIAVEPGSNFSFIIRKNDGSNQRVARYFTSSLLAGTAYTLLLKGYMQPPDGDLANKSSQIVFFRN